MQFWGSTVIVINGWETHRALEYEEKQSCWTFFFTAPVGRINNHVFWLIYVICSWSLVLEKTLTADNLKK